MKYFALDTVVTSFEENKNKTTDGFWGIMSILISLDQKINACKQYDIDAQKVSNNLEQWFSIKDEYKNYNSYTTWSVVFSTKWIENLSMFIKKNTSPNIYYVIAWMFQHRAFEHEPSHNELLSLFCNVTGIPFEDVKSIFNMKKVNLVFTDTKFTHKEKISYLFKKYGTPGKNCSINCKGEYIVSEPGAFQRAGFLQTLYSSSENPRCLILSSVDLKDYYPSNFSPQSSQDILEATNHPYQIIFFGAPGVGKSHYLKSVYKSDADTIRITFHPETDYASFVGCYKPQTEDGEIVYKFQGQAFAEAYIEAWKRFCSDSDGSKDFFLIIEEINRGNCAQIFGDIFQLLDRNDKGFSDYSVRPDKDLALYLQEAFADPKVAITDKLDSHKSGLGRGEIMILPPNLHIIATMNTSDQSLFPIDSAFKRRWDWVYMPIDTKPVDDKGKPITRLIETKEFCYDWGQFLDKVNQRIFKTTESEDKQLGFWFVKPKSGNSTISSSDFVSKVIFFLWNDIYKDFGDDASSIFYFASDGNPESKEKERHSFKDFTPGFKKVNDSLVDAFIKNLEVRAQSLHPTTNSVESNFEGETDANSN